MTENRNISQRRSGMPGRRYQVLEGRCFSVYQLPLNLSEEAYNRRLEELKKLGNMC